MKKSSKKYDNDWPIVAICYDFDKTLSPKDMQEFGLIPKLKCSSEEFWKESNEMAKQNGMDKILSYMLTIIQKADNKITIKKSDFKKLGKSIELFPGVDTWFERINNVAKEVHVNVEHYIISAGLSEIIQGTPIANFFEKIYASSFLYDNYGKPIWPCQVVNYTSKTQYLFRIIKDCLDLSDEDSVNEYKEQEARRIPFTNFIYIGDSETDIPAMKIIKNGGGTSIGVYNPQTRNMDRVRKLLKQERIDFLMPADYSEGSRIEKVVIDSLNKIRISYTLAQLNRHQKMYINDLEGAEYLVEYTDAFIGRESLDEQGVRSIGTQARNISKKVRRDLHSKHDNIASPEEIDDFMDKVDGGLKEVIVNKKKEIKKNPALPLSDGMEPKDEQND